MGLQADEGGNTTFLSIIGGKFKRTVSEDTDGAVRRDWSVGDKSGTKWELSYKAVTGMLDDIHYRESEYGTALNIRIYDGDEDFTVSIKADKEYAIDFAKRLPSVDLGIPVTLVPYQFKPEGEEYDKRGLNVFQGGEKLFTYYYDAVKKESVNGIPEPKGDTKKYSKAKWKAHFLNEFLFLQEEVEKYAVKLQDVARPVKESIGEAQVEADGKDPAMDLPF